MNNYYEILEVSKNASYDVISKIYKHHIKNSHPDLYTGEERKNAEAKVQKINEAYDVLSNPEKRKEYDLSLEELEKESKTVEETNKNISIEELKIENEYLKHKLSNCNKFIYDYFYERAPEVISIIENYDQDNNYKINLSIKSTVLRYLFTAIAFFVFITIILFIISISFKIDMFKIVFEIFSQK